MIYMMTEETTDSIFVKVGKTTEKNFHNRLNNYKTHNPQCKLVSYTKTDEIEDRDIEIWYHDYLRDWCCKNVNHTEWFEVPKRKTKLYRSIVNSGLYFPFRQRLTNAQILRLGNPPIKAKIIKVKEA